jgi:hypothetical protein
MNASPIGYGGQDAGGLQGPIDPHLPILNCGKRQVQPAHGQFSGLLGHYSDYHLRLSAGDAFAH